jgi:hypothetical protein
MVVHLCDTLAFELAQDTGSAASLLGIVWPLGRTMGEKERRPGVTLHDPHDGFPCS